MKGAASGEALRYFFAKVAAGARAVKPAGVSLIQEITPCICNVTTSIGAKTPKTPG